MYGIALKGVEVLVIVLLVAFSEMMRTVLLGKEATAVNTYTKIVILRLDEGN